MARQRSRLVDYAVFLVVRTAICLLQALSWETALGLARSAAGWAYRLNRRHREIALDNVAQAFPDYTPAQCRAVVRRSYEHLAMMVVEMILAPRKMRFSNHKQFIECAPADVERLKYYWYGTAPMLTVTGHFGNWEVLGYLTGLLGFKAKVIARKLDNPYLDRFITRFRQQAHVEILDKETDYDRIVNTLSTGGLLVMVGDQDAGRKGYFVDFLNRPASTYKSIALLSLEHSAPVIVVAAARVGTPMRYRVYVEDIIEPTEYADDVDGPRRITERYTAALERLVRRHPEQYFWVHRRWKSYEKYKLKRAA